MTARQTGMALPAFSLKRLDDAIRAENRAALSVGYTNFNPIFMSRLKAVACASAPVPQCPKRQAAPALMPIFASRRHSGRETYS
ncbi:MAG TPA: hypothetical protein VMW70_17580 [Burkholderiales bacterium]|nr:hypothetical protein [Burkholderiales bacterium]